MLDPYLRFYLRFVLPGLDEADRGRGDIVLHLVEQAWSSWGGRAVEPVVRDALDRLLRPAADGVTGAFDAVGPTVLGAPWVRLSWAVGGHTGPVVEVPADWLLAQGVEPHMGPESLAIWAMICGWAGG